MHFLTYVHKGKESIGVVYKENYVIPFEELFKDNLKAMPLTLLEFIKTSDEKVIIDMKNSVENKTYNMISTDDVEFLAPIPYPQRDIICLGKNYKKHAIEIADSIVNREVIPTQPIYFAKSAFPALGHDGDIDAHPEVTSEVDYEVELAVVIGKNGRNIKLEQAEEYIFGYTIINDVSARDLQHLHQQWFRGKSLDTFCPMGPHIVHKSEIPFPVELEIFCKVNGEVRQCSNTRNMIFDIAYIIHELSKGMELKAGDIIATGTPEGVGLGFKPPRFLKPGDIVECEIERIGTLRNKVR